MTMTAPGKTWHVLPKHAFTLIELLIVLAEAEDDEFAEAGAIGLWTKADAITEFDDFSMTSAWKEMVEELK